MEAGALTCRLRPLVEFLIAASPSEMLSATVAARWLMLLMLACRLRLLRSLMLTLLVCDRCDPGRDGSDRSESGSLM